MNLKLYLSGPVPCSYLKDQQSRSIFIDPAVDLSDDLVNQLSMSGFRRSGTLLYRPHCEECHQCMSCRVICQQFTPSRSQKRILKKAADLNWQLVPMQYSQEHYELYQSYIEGRHQDGDMYPPSSQQYKSFLICTDIKQQLLEVRTDDGRLICGAVVDVLQDGISAVYSYFDPQLAQLSLGQLAILLMIKHCQTNQLAHLYLGFWIRDSQKMSYKKNYPPLTFFDGKSWVAEPDHNKLALDL